MSPKQYGLVLALVPALFSLAACATNPFQKFYKEDANQDKPASFSGLAAIDEDLPLLLHGTDPDADSRRMRAEGYTLLGTSSFFAGPIDDSQATAQGRGVHAAIVMLYSSYKDTLSSIAPITSLDDDSSSGMFGTGNVNSFNGSAANRSSEQRRERFNYFASYWVKP